MMKRIVKLTIACYLAFLSAGCDTEKTSDANLARTSSAIINGETVPDGEYNAVVALMWYEKYISCSGALITPEWVLTAGHCLYGDPYAPEDLSVFFGSKVKNPTYKAAVKDYYLHPGFTDEEGVDKGYDVGLIHLAEPVPESIATPMRVILPANMMTAEEVDNGDLFVKHVGFGQTAYGNREDPTKRMTAGTKHKYTSKVAAYCPRDPSKNSSRCESIANLEVIFDIYVGEYVIGNFIILDGSKGGTTYYDSGSPLLLDRDGTEYITGVCSMGYVGYTSLAEDKRFMEYTDITPYYDSFLAEHIPELDSCYTGKNEQGHLLFNCNDAACSDKDFCKPEDCFNGSDDNRNGAIDCEDESCKSELKCQPEICDDKIDNNDNNLKDCDDPQCKDALNCQPEICNDRIDNNGDNLKDCDDPQCEGVLYCEPEICDDGIDNNGDNLIDCKDPKCNGVLICEPEICDDGIDNNGDDKTDCNDTMCLLATVCQPEVCDDGIDNNANQKADCDDPECENTAICLPEICDNKVDDNGDDRIDCQDPKCRKAAICQPENCTDGFDNNDDGLKDCDDPQCSYTAVCQKEICDDGKDNDGDGLKDCDDSDCAESCASNSGSGSDCSGVPSKRSAPVWPLIAAGLIGAGLFSRRRAIILDKVRRKY